MDEYNPNLTYRFTDKDGNVIEAKGDNGFVQESIQSGIPISVNSKGEWFDTPYMEATNGKVTAYIPEWFKQTDEYKEWTNYYTPQITSNITNEQFSNLQSILSSYGDQARGRRTVANEAIKHDVGIQELQDKYYQDLVSIATEKAGNGNASLSIYGQQFDSAADAARYYKDLGKDELSRRVTAAQQVLDNARSGQYTSPTDQAFTTDTLTLIELLTQVNDNPSQFGENNEFQGLLEASTLQKLGNLATAALQSLSEQSVFGWPARLVYGLGEELQGRPFSVQIENAREGLFNRSDLGGGLSGREGFIQAGNVVGSLENIAVTWSLSKVLGTATQGSAAVLNPDSFLNKVSARLGTVGGSLATNFFLNDVPIDASFAITKAARGENWFIDTERTQPLIKTPASLAGAFGVNVELGPQVPDGMFFDMVGDAIVDSAGIIIPTVNNAAFQKLDDLTNGAVSRVREKMTLKNMEIQTKLGEIPVVGKFFNKAMGAEDAALVRMAKQTSVATGSTDWYIKAQNSITLSDTNGVAVVGPKVKTLDKDYGISDSIKKFQSESNKYGGFSETKASISEAVGGAEKVHTRTVIDDLPSQVKYGVLDIERLGELQGQREALGGLPLDTKAANEIAELEERVSVLPQEIKTFADRFSQYNKAIEQLASDLGVKPQDWIDAINLDPQYAKYMVRQALIPYDEASYTGSTDTNEPSIWSKGRTGTYNRDSYIDPTQAVALKVEALGRAYAYNERSKLVAAMQAAQGKVIAGKGSVKAAERLGKIQTELKGAEAVRKQIDYDATVGSFSTEMSGISSAISKVNNILSGPENIAVKAVYDGGANAEIKGMVNDFYAGKISFGEGVKETAGLSDYDAADVISNTYALKGQGLDRIFDSKVEGDVNLDSIVGSGAKLLTADDLFPSIKDPDYKAQVFEEYDYAKKALESKTIDELMSDIYDPDGSAEIGEAYRTIYKDRDFEDTPADLEISDALDSLPQTVLENKLTAFENLPAKEVLDIRPEQILGKGDRRFSGYNEYSNRVYDKINEVMDSELYKFAEELQAKGYRTSLTDSRVSESKYLRVEDADGKAIIVRLADHESTGSGWGSDAEIFYKDDYGYDRTIGATLQEMKDQTLDLIDSELGAPGQSVLASGSSEMSYDIPDSAKVTPSAMDYNAGVTQDGRAFRYEIEDGVITSMEEITDSQGLADAVNHLGGVYRVSENVISQMGMENAHGLIRTIQYYKSEMPNLSTGPTYKLADGGKGTYGWIPTPGAYGNQPQYNFHIEDGHIVASETPVYMGSKFYTEKNLTKLKNSLTTDVNARFHPKNSNFVENVPVHETGHNYMARLALARLNDQIDQGLVKLPDDATDKQINELVLQSWKDTHELVAKNALKKMGYRDSDAEWQRQASTISRYAGKGDYTTKTYRYETLAEAQVDYKANGGNASPFTLAVLDEVKRLGERYSIAAEPGVVLNKNGITIPKGMMEDNQYNFPKNVKTDTQKAKWLDGWRQKNPYLKGEFNEDTYIKANKWDTFFQRELYSYDGEYESSMPNKLLKMNGDFLEEYSAKAAKNMVEEIRKVSGNFTEELATMALSKNANDTSDAIDNFLIGKVNEMAQGIASKMPGGATEDNLNKARATLWAEPAIKNDAVQMVSSLLPGQSIKASQDVVNRLFTEQANGFASIDPLQIDTAKLIGERNDLYAEINRNNRYAKKLGKELDAKREGWTKDTTQIISFKQNGEDVYIVVDDPTVASVLKRPVYKEHGIMGETGQYISNFVNRAYRLGTTSINPVNYIKNVLRDPMQATIQGGFNPLNMSLSPEVFYHTLRIYGLDEGTIQEVSAQLKSWSDSTTMSEYLKRVGLNDPNSVGYKSKVEKVSKEFNEKFFGNKIVHTLEIPLELWEGTFRNEIAQQSFIKNYKRTGDVNKAMGAAMLDASNSTTNFSHAVKLFNRASGTAPYLASAINGTRSFWVQFTADPVGMVTRITSGFMVPAMAITAWNLSNDDRRERYMSLPEWYRDTHMVLVGDDGNVASLPIPDELGQYYGTIRRLVEYTNNVNKQGIPSILLQGAFGFLPMDVDGFFKDDGSVDMVRGVTQMMSGLLPQAVTAIYEYVAEQDLYTGEDLSGYNWVNKHINLLSNVFGTGIRQAINDIGMLLGVPEKELIGKSTMNTLSRELFGMGMDDAKNQFMAIVGSPASTDPNTRKQTKASGLFAENEKLQQQLASLDRQIAYSAGDEKQSLEEKKQQLTDEFTQKVSNLVHNYMELYTQTGGLADWQKTKIVQILTLGSGTSSGSSSTYQAQDAQQAYLNERGLAMQRYVQAGLPAGASRDQILSGENSIELQAAINRFYGVNKQAAADFKTALKETKLKDIRSQFYDAISKIYDIAEEYNTSPDYDMIEKIQARYLQAVDNVLVPIVNQYGISILNNNDFINEVRSYVNGMIPSDDWRQSVRNAKKFLSTKDFPTATVDVKKWLIQRYSTGLKSRGISSDSEVTKQLEAIKSDLDAGRGGAASGRIESLLNGVNKANYYISAEDLQTLTRYKNMLK